MGAIDLAQWAVLAFMAVFLFGLTRQLGRFMTPAENDRALEMGPDVGRSVADLLTPEAKKVVQERMSAAGADFASLVVVNQACDACEEWMRVLADNPMPESGPRVLVTKTTDDGYLAKLRGIGDTVVVDGDGRLLAGGIRGWPFLMLVDRQLRLIHKQLGGDPLAPIRRAARQRGNATAADTDGSRAVTATGA